MALTKPKFLQIETLASELWSGINQVGGLGFACGVWDFRASINFGTGVITPFATDNVNRPALPIPFTSYSGDSFSQLLGLQFFISDNFLGMPGGVGVDATWIFIGTPGSSGIDNSSGAPAPGDSGTRWAGNPALGLVVEGGVVSSPTIDIDFGGGVIGGSSSAVYYVGRIGFQAIGIKA